MKLGAAPADTAALRIVTQYWRGNTRVCEFATREQRLDIYIASHGGEVGGRCSVEARNGPNDGAARIRQEASTRSEALFAVALDWRSRTRELGLPSHDWELVTAALRAVGAIDR
ncbi:MAG TPA: hypothetical protein VFK05_06980 [Polyangiaceae bacterium]|nr:hypothetical protein [Polyangiaceae bacterium]